MKRAEAPTHGCTAQSTPTRQQITIDGQGENNEVNFLTSCCVFIVRSACVITARKVNPFYSG
jgi:hypothetical protein